MHTTEYRWAAQDLFGQMPELQFTGPGTETIDLPGVIYPEWRGGFGQVASMRALAAAGESLGRWVIARIAGRDSTFADQGRARKIEFALSLRRVAFDHWRGLRARKTLMCEYASHGGWAIMHPAYRLAHLIILVGCIDSLNS